MQLCNTCLKSIGYWICIGRLQHANLGKWRLQNALEVGIVVYEYGYMSFGTDDTVDVHSHVFLGFKVKENQAVFSRHSTPHSSWQPACDMIGNNADIQ